MKVFSLETVQLENGEHMDVFSMYDKVKKRQYQVTCNFIPSPDGIEENKKITGMAVGYMENDSGSIMSLTGKWAGISRSQFQAVLQQAVDATLEPFKE